MNTAPIKTIFLTGGTGALGHSLAERLLEEGFSVKILTRKSPPSAKKNIEYIQGEITDKALLQKAISNCQAVVHAAGEKSDSSRMQAVNVTGTQKLCEVLSENPVHYFCHISSVGVIGKCPGRVADENTPCHPMNLYEKTKLEAEKIVLRCTSSARTVILRPANVLTPESHDPEKMFTPAMQLKIWLKGRENAFLVNVQDVAEAVIYFMKNPFREKIYILSEDAPEFRTHAQVFQYLAKRLGKKPFRLIPSPPVFLPWLLRSLKGHRSNQGDLVYSSKRILGEGFVYKHGIEKGLDDLLDKSS